ncbi:hypothetical protein YC2023_090067 [Brassica napus]
MQGKRRLVLEINRNSVMMRKFHQMEKILNQLGAPWRRYFGNGLWENKARTKEQVKEATSRFEVNSHQQQKWVLHATLPFTVLSFL